jgi:four helix bundle protein
LRQNEWVISNLVDVISKGTRGQGFKGSSDPPESYRIKMLKNYKDLKVWKKSYKLCLEIYRMTAKFPTEEKYGLTSQIRRSVVSIPSNIAEGYGRKTTLDYVRMLYISYGSVCELETQILLAGDLNLIEKGDLDTLKENIAEIERMLKALIKSLENKSLNP